MNYEILQHTGDAKIKVFGETKEALFVAALRGMNAILKAKGKREKAKVRKIVLQSADINMLLVDFLSEVNYLRQVNMEVYESIKIDQFSDTKLEGELSGYAVEELGEDIKAVTFHELDIKKNKEGVWETVIIFDI